MPLRVIGCMSRWAEWKKSRGPAHSFTKPVVKTKQQMRQRDITSCLQDMDEASLSRVHLERRMEALQEEILFLRRSHDEVDNQD